MRVTTTQSPARRRRASTSRIASSPDPCSSFRVRTFFVLAVAMVAAAAACSDETTAQRPPGQVVVDGGGRDSEATSDGGGVPRRPGVLRIAQFNVRRFFDTVCDTGTCGGTSFEEQPSQAAFDMKVDALAKGIVLIDPDVISLE